MASSQHSILYTWLQEMKIPVSKTYLRQQLLSHPSYPSLLCITDTLDELGIENSALQIEKENIKEMPVPFLAHLNNGDYSIVKDANYLEKQVPDFFEQWDGIVVAAEKPDNLQHKENNNWLLKEKKKFTGKANFTLVLIAFIITTGFMSGSWLYGSLLLLAIACLCVSWMIVSKDLGIENKIADQVCGKDADCDSVIQSKNAKLVFGIGWSDAGIIYFSFLLASLLISSINENSNGLNALLSILATCALPVTFLSIYYQWRLEKKWCRLCLITVALLWAQFLVLLPVALSLLYGDFNGLTLNNALLASFLLFTTTTAWLWLKPLLQENKKLELENFEGKRFKNNPEVFKALLEKQKKIATNPDGLGILMGNPAAPNTIIKVCNPYCGPCAKAHTVIEELLASNSKIKVQMLFAATDDEKDMKAKPVKHLLALHDKSDQQLMQQALDDWYMADKKNYDAFAAKYILNGELEMQGEKLNAMKAWCDNVKIDFTPTFFVNGYQLPKEYTIDDVKYFLS